MPPITFQELGLTGLRHWGGYVFEEPLAELRGERGKRAIRAMVENDAVVNAILYAIEMQVRKVDWNFNPPSQDKEDVERAHFLQGCLIDDMSQTWPDTLAEILTMLPWGFSYLETVFKLRSGESRDPSKNSKFDDGRIGWRKWAIRSQESLLRWEIDEEGGIQGMHQIPPPDYRPRFIPIDKSLLFRTTAHKGNPEGRSILRGAYRPFYFKQKIENIEAIGIERDLAGLPVAEVPLEVLLGSTPDDVTTRDAIKEIVTNIRRDEQEGVVWPLVYDDKGNKKYVLSLLSSGGQRQFETDKIIQRYDQRIAICVMADFLLLGHTQRSGSYGMAEVKNEMFATALSAWLDSIAATINRHAVPRLLRLNGMPVDNAPILKHGSINDVDLKELAEVVNQYSGANITFNPIQQEWLKGKLGSDFPKDETVTQVATERFSEEQEPDSAEIAGMESSWIKHAPRSARGLFNARATTNA